MCSSGQAESEMVLHPGIRRGFLQHRIMRRQKQEGQYEDELIQRSLLKNRNYSTLLILAAITVPRRVSAPEDEGVEPWHAHSVP